ncbi:MAG: metallophosphoesterase [Promethearchaeota archaeon]
MSYEAFLEEQDLLRQKIKEQDILYLKERLETVKAILKNEPTLLVLEKCKYKTLVIGDTHGDILSTQLAVERFSRTNIKQIVFLGDYVDRGKEDVLNLHLVLSLKIRYPDKVFLLRGNHETPEVNQVYGFKNHLKELGQITLSSLYDAVLGELPLALQLNDTLMIHGGLVEGLETLDELAALKKQIIPSDPRVKELLWNDPHEDVEGFLDSYLRGGGTKVFGESVVKSFLKRNSLQRMIRSHEPVEEGYTKYWKGKFWTVFSCFEYYGCKRGFIELNKKKIKGGTL